MFRRWGRLVNFEENDIDLRFDRLDRDGKEFKAFLDWIDSSVKAHGISTRTSKISREFKGVTFIWGVEIIVCIFFANAATSIKVMVGGVAHAEDVQNFDFIYKRMVRSSKNGSANVLSVLRISARIIARSIFDSIINESSILSERQRFLFENITALSLKGSDKKRL